MFQHFIIESYASLYMFYFIAYIVSCTSKFNNMSRIGSNLAISSWNIQGLGDKCRDDFFLSFMKYDINILLETWKGTDHNYNLKDYKIFQKCRKKKKRSKRFSGGIVILYKSTIHDGIKEICDVTSSENRIWLKLDKTFFGLTRDLYVCACYVPPISSTYYDDDFSKIENEISYLSQKGHILLIGDLNSRISNRNDFIENESDFKDSLSNFLPDNYTTDFNIHRNSMDKVFNTQGQSLIDLCIASQLRVLNGRFVGDLFGNVTCYKSYGASTVDYCLANMDLINNVNFFQVFEPTYLSDHTQIVVHIKCKYSSESGTDNNNINLLNKLDNSYKWESVSKIKLLEALSEKDTVDKIVNFESSKFENNSKDINEATTKLTEIFDNLAKRSCKIMKHRKKKTKKKKPWGDMEVKDLKSTVNKWGRKLRLEPYNGQVRSTFYKHCKSLKKTIKRKKISL